MQTNLNNRERNSVSIHTKEKILLEATRLFAINGFSAVSMRDIADSVGIKPPSIYNYYVSKDDLLAEILERFKASYDNYFDWLSEMNSNAESLEEVIENMFIQLKDVHGGLFVYYGIAIVLKEQFHNELARKIAFQTLYTDSIENLKTSFDELIEKNLIPACDTKAISTFFMYNVLIGNELRIHEAMGHELPMDCTEMYTSLSKLISNMLKDDVVSIG